MNALRTSSESFREKIRDNERLQHLISYLPPLNFITVHYAYFIIICLITSLIFWGSSDPSRSITYTDSLFLVVSAMTEAGLNTVNLSQMTTFQQFLLWFLIMIGSSIFVSIGTVLTRKRVFESRFKGVVRELKERGRGRSRRGSMSMARGTSESGASGTTAVEGGVGKEFESRHSMPRDPPSPSSPNGGAKENTPIGNGSAFKSQDSTSSPAANGGNKENIRFQSNDGSEDAVVSEEERPKSPDLDRISILHYAPSPSPSRGHHRVLSFAGVGAHPNSTSYNPSPGGIYNRKNNGPKTPATLRSQLEDDLGEHWYPHYLTRHTTGRNGEIFGLSKAERDHLGGVEYRAITLLAWIVPVYFILWQLLGCLGLAAWMAHNKADTSRGNGINPWWLGAFNAVSAFNNSGMSLLDANMIPFQTSTYPVITMGLLILAGNTAYPLFLRLILWSLLKLLSTLYPSPEAYADYKATLRFILTYPRRVYTNLFPSAPTWWLLFMLIVLNGIDWAAFELLNIGNAALNTIPTNYRVLDGLFQALAVRSGGFYIVSITSLRIGVQVLYVIMMYISVYPVVITMRHSNVYEERSLGIYSDEEPSDSDPESLKLGNMAAKLRRTLTNAMTPILPATTTMNNRSHFLRQQVRGQLAHDLWWLVLAILFISCIEVANFERDPVTYSVFNIAFEVVSGYGCVGISTGLPNAAYSFSGGWHVASKLILCAVMLRGRHRGLPVALDRAVRLPGADGEPGEMEEEDAGRRRSVTFQRGERDKEGRLEKMTPIGREIRGLGFSPLPMQRRREE